MSSSCIHAVTWLDDTEKSMTVVHFFVIVTTKLDSYRTTKEFSEHIKFLYWKLICYSLFFGNLERTTLSIATIGEAVAGGRRRQYLQNRRQWVKTGQHQRMHRQCKLEQTMKISGFVFDDIRSRLNDEGTVIRVIEVQLNPQLCKIYSSVSITTPRKSLVTEEVPNCKWGCRKK